jgi:DNA-binding IclR family transcriptional regulator
MSMDFPAQMDTAAISAALPESAVPALIRGFAILDLISQSPGLDFTSIHSRLGLPKSSTHNLLVTLCRLRVLQQQSDRSYVLGLRLTELGTFAAGQRFIEKESVPLLRALAREERLTCHLGVREGREAVYLSKCESDQPIKIDSWVGKRFPLHSSALGKALLAWLPPHELARAIDDIAWDKRTTNTIGAPDDLQAHLALVRAQGYATDDEENITNIRCVAAPVFDLKGGVVAAISATGTVLQLDKARFEQLALRLITVSSEISRRSFGTKDDDRKTLRNPRSA